MPAYSEIDEVKACRKDGADSPMGWGFCLWSDLLDDEAPHRPLLEQLARDHPEMTLTLPAWQLYEDFVEGSIWTGQFWVKINFETIFSHMSLWAFERQAVETVRELLLPSASA